MFTLLLLNYNYYFYYRRCATTFLCTYIFLNSYVRDELIMTCEKEKKACNIYEIVYSTCVRACMCSCVYVRAKKKIECKR